jgi:selenide,water dikinase
MRHARGRQPVPIAQDLVLVGGGHAHVAVLKRFGMRPAAGVRLTLIARDVETPYSGMLPGYVAGLYQSEECHIEPGRG